MKLEESHYYHIYHRGIDRRICLVEKKSLNTFWAGINIISFWLLRPMPSVSCQIIFIC